MAMTRLLRLYEARSLVRAAFPSMGMVLTAKTTVATAPAAMGMELVMRSTVGMRGLGPRRLRHPFDRAREWVL